MDNVLEEFTFYLRGRSGFPLVFQANVYAWSGNPVVGNPPQGSIGPALFTSPNLTFTPDGTFQPITVSTGGLALTPGGVYVALFTTSDPGSIAANDPNATGGLSYSWGGMLGAIALFGDGGGSFNFYANATSAELSVGPWDGTVDSLGTLAWRARLTAVPEPVSFVLLGGVGRVLRLPPTKLKQSEPIPPRPIWPAQSRPAPRQAEIPHVLRSTCAPPPFGRGATGR